MTGQRTQYWLSMALAAVALLGSTSSATELNRPDYFSQRLIALTKELNEDIASPRAAATLYELASLKDDLPSLSPLAEALSGAASNPDAPGEVRQLALFLLAQVHKSQGQLEACDQDLAGLTFARVGWLVGGFDNEGSVGQNAAYGPEQGPIDLKATYQGKNTQIGWQKVPALGPGGIIPVSDLLRPRRNITFYYVTTLEVPRAEAAVLHFGGSGATKLWVNDNVVMDDADDHPARFDQHAVGLQLRPGANVILMKVSTLDETPALYLRVSSLKGTRLRDAHFVAPDPDHALRPPVRVVQHRKRHEVEPLAASTEKVPYEDVTDRIAGLVKAHPEDASLHEDYATVLFARRPFDSKQQLNRREQEKAVALTPKDARAQTFLAKYINDDQNEVRKALSAALAADPSFAPARTGLSAYYLEHGFVRRAYDEAARAASDDPSYYQGQLELSQALATVGLAARGRRLQLTLLNRFPTIPAVLLSAARTERALGRTADAIKLYRRVIDLRYDDTQARSELAGILLDAGDLDGALAQLHDMDALHPTSVPLGLHIAELLSTNGRPKEAMALYDRLALMAPEDDGILEARGKHELRTGNARLAMEDFKHALGLKPQNAELQELVREVQPQENFAEPYLRDAVALAKEAHAHPIKGDDEAVVLANVDVVRVFQNGLSSRVHQQVIEVLNDRGVDHNRIDSIQYAPGDEEIKVEQARIIKKDGTVIDAKTETDQELTDSWAGEYFDFRQHTVSFPNVEPGDVIELTYRKDDISQENMFANYFGDVEFLQEMNPIQDVEYVLIAPADRTLYSNEPTLSNLKHTERKTADGKQILRWEARNVPKIEPEPHMPGWANVAAYLHVSTFKEWDDVAKFWWGMVHDQLHVTPDVAKAADDAVAGIPASDIRGRVRAVYDFVVTKTRYVGIEFGIHGFKPYTVDRILARRFGDCKDKASLMYAMLAHLGIKSNLVLLRMRNLGRLNSMPASLAVFNHCILYVPALHAFLDGTADFSGSGELPDPDQGAQVLVVQNDGKTPSVLSVTPVSVPDDNVTTSHIKINLAPDGSAEIEGQSQVRGQGAQSYRRTYEAETGRRQKFEQSYATRYPGAHVTLFDIGDPHAIEKPVDTRFALTVPHMARTEGRDLVLTPFGRPPRFAQAEAALSQRHYPVELGVPWLSQFQFTVTLPAGYTLADRAVAERKSSPFGSYEYDLKPSGNQVVVSGHISFSMEQVPPEQYSAFRSFLEDVDRSFARELHLSPTAAPNASEASR